MCKADVFYFGKEDLYKKTGYFTKTEIALWCISALTVTVSFFIGGGRDYLNLAASLVGITSLILCAKGNSAGQVLMIVFSIMYGIVSLSFRYYGEMMTYLGMTAPMAVFSLVSWLKNPYEGNRSEVRLDSLSKRSAAVMAVLTVVVTALFYFILKELGTANIIPSTISVATSFIAAYLTFKRSRFLSFAYAMNDIVLIILWTAASFADISYITVDICFVVFFANDMYGFINLTRIARRQKTDK